jgi:hypothetical protein
MKRLQQLGISVVLALMFSVSTLAGDIGMPKAPPPPSSSSETTPGQIETPGYMYIDFGSSDSVGLTALSLLQGILSVF